MAVSHPLLEIFICAQAPVYHPVIPGLVAMPLRLKQRPDVNGCALQISGVIRPGSQLVKMLLRFPFIFSRASAQPQRINMIKYCAVIPCHNVSPPSIFRRPLRRLLFGAFPTAPPRKYFFHFVLRICLILPFFRRSVTVFLTGWQYAGDASRITRPTNDDAGHGSTESRAKCQPLSQFFCFQADFFPFFLSSHSSFRRIYAKFLCPLWNFSFQRRKFTDFFRNALA